MARLFLFLLLLAKATEGHGEELLVTHSADKHIILSADSCDTLSVQSDALKVWTKKLGEVPAVDSKCECEKNSEKTVCHLDVTNLAPLFVQKMDKVVSAGASANCWNGALVADKIIPNLRFSKQDEWNFWLNSPLCKMRAKGEMPEPGDLVAIRSHHHESKFDEIKSEVHGIVYLSPELCFSKKGPGMSEYSLVSLNTELSDWVEAKCRGVFSGQPAECESWTTFYTCKTYQEYFEDKLISKKITGIQDQLSKIECDPVPYPWVKTVEELPSGSVIESLSATLKIQESTLAAIDQMANEALNNDFRGTEKLSDDERILWKSILVRTVSIRDEIESPLGRIKFLQNHADDTYMTSIHKK